MTTSRLESTADMTEQEYNEALKYIEEHFDIGREDPCFNDFLALVEAVEEYEGMHYPIGE